MVLTNTRKISTKLTVKQIPSTGISLDVLGTDSATKSRQTAIANKMVMQKPILSPLSQGMAKPIYRRELSPRTILSLEYVSNKLLLSLAFSPQLPVYNTCVLLFWSPSRGLSVYLLTYLLTSGFEKMPMQKFDLCYLGLACVKSAGCNRAKQSALHCDASPR